MEMTGAEADVIWWWAWAWRSVTAAAAAGACLLLVLHVAEALWWRPRRLEAHFAARPAVPIPPRLRARDAGTHGAGRRQAHVATRLARRAPPGAPLLPPLEDNLR
jgi:hypothetical protein